ncbi:Mitochondrial import inner membrane translocase subunit Tim21 [Coemansia sp. Benny D115]|nr:Mitochondrial import inner membrane translocase subunit Tim21 [Coemansia sp. Benny D115]
MQVSFHALPRQPYRLYSTGRAAQVAGTAGNVLIIGSVMTLFGYIIYTLYDNLIAESGTTRVYNDSLDLIRANPQIKELFGPSVAGFGEPGHSQRQRQRAIAHRNFDDAQGRSRLTMQYYIQDAQKQLPYLGVVKLDLVQSPHTKSWDYNYIIVDVYSKDAASRLLRPGGGSAGGGVSAETRVEILVTDEFAKEVRVFENARRNQRFSTANRGSSDGSWLSALNPANWRR